MLRGASLDKEIFINQNNFFMSLKRTIASLRRMFVGVRYALIIMLLAGGGISTAMAQNLVKGNVVDQKGQAMVGATVVLLEDTTKGTITDADGNFELPAAAGQTLQFSSIGYKTLDVKLGSQTTIKVTMEEDLNQLEDVVVIGYGTARKGDLTGSISSVNGSLLSNRSTQQISTAMQGQIAGVQVTRSAGGPGGSASVRVRGVTTMSTNDPLVIVDGVPSSLNDVLASDVETMTVLKDAASAAIYGARAAAGVILITTKRAKQNAFSLDYNYEFALDTPTTRAKNAGAVEWFKMYNELKWNDGASEHSTYSPEYIDSYMENHAKDPIHYPDVDWIDLALDEVATHQQHTLSMSGGTKNLRTKFTFNYQEGEGYYENKGYERYAGRLNNDYQITDWMRANVDLDFSASESTSPALGNAIYWAHLIAPIYNPYWADGSFADVKDGGNVLAALANGGKNTTNHYKFGAKAQLDITPVKGLTLTAIFAPRFNFTKGKNFSKATPVYYEDGRSIMHQSLKTTNLSESRNDGSSRTYQFYANYANQWGDHSFSAMVGYEAFKNKWENLGASRNNYELDTFPYLNVGPEDYQYNSGSAGHNAYQSVFGRLMYSYKNKYMIQANMRADASSRFHKDNRWGVFPSVSAGWVASEEPWFKNNVVEYLKVRASYGQLGNERIGSEFPYMATMSTGNSYMYDKGSQSVTAAMNAAQVYYAFNDITWETTTTYGVGVDMSFLDQRLRLTADYYYKKTENMLLTLGFPSYAGFSAPQQNAGDMYTKGWDLEIGWGDTVGDFSYRISANISDYRSRMGYLGDRRTISGSHITEEGSYFNEWFLYKSDGLFVTAEDLYDENGNKYPTLSANDKEGNIKFIDIKEDGVINEDDKIRMGNSQPEYLYGGNISLGWKGLDFSLSFQGIGHQNSMFNYYWVQPLKEQWGSLPELLVGNYWSKYNTPEQNAKVKYPRLTYTNTSNTYARSDYWMFNGAYFRVKNITLGYSLPENILKHVRMKSLRFYVSVNDLPAISNYPKGWDPELGWGSDYISTSFIFGVNVKF